MRDRPHTRSLSIIAAYCGIVLATWRVDVTCAETPAAIVSEGQLTLVIDVSIPAMVDGRVRSIQVHEGDSVKVDDLLVQLDDAVSLADRDAAHWDARVATIQQANDVDLRYARKVLGVQQKELARSTAANERFPNSVSLTELSRLELVVEQSRLAIEKAARDLEVAQATAAQKESLARGADLRWQHHAIRAPEAGTVVEILPSVGEWVAAGQPVVRVLRTDPLRVEAFIDGQTLAKTLVGQPLQFTPRIAQGQAAQSFAGKVVFVSPEIHPVTGQIRIRGEIPNPDGWLRPGLNGTLSIELQPLDAQP